MPDPSTKIQSVERAIKIMDALTQAPTVGLTLGQVAKAVGVNASTVHHILCTLITHQMVEQDPSSKLYRPGIHLIELGNSALSSTGIARVARPYVESIWQSTGQSVTLLVFHGLVRTGILSTSSREILTVQRAPLEITTLHATGSGKLLLAFLPEQDVQDYLHRARLERFTSNTITQPEALLRELEKIRAENISLDHEEHGKGVRCISAPIRDASLRVAGCLDVVFPCYNISEEQIYGWIEQVRENAQKLSQQLRSLGLVVN